MRIIDSVRQAAPVPEGGRRVHTWAFRVGGSALCALVVAFAGCDDGPTEPGGEGAMETQARDGDGTAQHVGAFDLAADTEGDVEGEVTGDATVEVRTEGGTWQELGTLADLDMSAELRTGNGETMGSAQVEARTYEAIRIVLESVEADVEAGSELGAGPIEVGVSVSVAGGGDVVIEHNAPVTVEADATTQVTLDINSHVWLDDEAAEAEAVTAAEFEGAAEILVE